MTAEHFQVIFKNPGYETSIRILTIREKAELQKIIETLEVAPFPEQNNRLSKPLRRPLEGKYVLRIANGKYRLIYSIELNSKKVFLWYVKPSQEYTMPRDKLTLTIPRVYLVKEENEDD
ncbi:hypothetical protein NWT39_00075 [Nitrososphaera viennensis]|uniref:Uncharacterized protein n=2 Tax=Nitrososphaera viennensis TaxID=1034015 RepID=A0A060HFP0_9ARCH|nr:hypothetical protein [Nitrososphaera viennensis]AIC14200.1 hypothetical protein NVIE_000180 [Nitrososphaera viennensis EN76]UVS69201.1 hypothetical protein NWT39_00075 [Nitrososphaera viennensis]